MNETNVAASSGLVSDLIQLIETLWESGPDPDPAETTLRQGVMSLQ